MLIRLNDPLGFILTKDDPWESCLDGVDGALVYERQGSRWQPTWSAIRATYRIVIALILIAALIYLGYDWLSK